MRWHAVLLALPLLLAGGCGEPLPAIQHHGLRLGALDRRPGGETVEIGRITAPMKLVADIDVRWQVVRDGGPEEQGRAHFEIEQVVTRQAGGLHSEFAVRVIDPEGVAAQFVKGLDGVRLSAEHDEDGRLRPATFRYATQTPASASRWLHDLWLGGFGPGLPWTPTRPIRVGEVWARDTLGSVEAIETVDGVRVPDVRSSGGVRLDALLEDASGTRLARLTLESLLEAEGHIRRGVDTAAVSAGHLTWGVAVLRIEDGTPESWTYRDRTRYLADDGLTRQDIDLVTEVVGRVRRLGD